MDTKEKSERLIEAACAVLSAAPDQRLNAVVLNKVLFYLDLAYLRDHGKTLTNSPYIALQQGPVVAKYPQRLIGQLEELDIAVQIDEWDGSKPICLKESPIRDFQFMSGADRQLASLVTTFFAEQTSRQASDYSHENPGWQLAWAEYLRERKPRPINLLVAMQQIIEDDPWMDQPILDDDQILVAADQAVGADW